MTKSRVGSVVHSQPISNSRHILDLVSSNRKGASKKLRRKGPLESSSNRAKVFFTITIFVYWKFITNKHFNCWTCRPPHRQTNERDLELVIVILKRTQSMSRHFNYHIVLCRYHYNISSIRQPQMPWSMQKVCVWYLCIQFVIYACRNVYQVN